MPFKKVLKEGEAPSEFTGMNTLKNLWRARAEDVTATPRQRQSATSILSMLHTTDPIMKKMFMLEILTEAGARVGYKISSNIDLTDPSMQPLETFADDILKHLTGGAQ